MSQRTDAAIGADRRRVQRAALRAGLWVGLASAVVVVLLSVATVAALFASSRDERRPPGEGGPGHRGPRVIEIDDVVPIAVVIGILGVAALGVIAWYVARRAAAPLAEALEVQRSFVADASHELRTPLTTLTSRIQLAQHRAERGGDVTGALEDLRRDAALMDEVLADLLTAAETAGGQRSDAASVADVGTAAADAVATLDPVASGRNVVVVADVESGLLASADPVALRRAVTALLDNAVRYAPGGSTVRVVGRGLGRSVAIRVVDEGGGIVGIDPRRVFDRFARADDGTRGAGLGLALVRDVAERFGGRVSVEATSPSGTTVLLELPKATSVSF